MNKTNQKGGTVLRAVSVLLTIVFTLSLTACKSREPITAEVFKETVEKLEYTVIDITDEYAEFPHILKAFLCADDSVHVEFLEIDSKDNATGVFNGNKAKVEAYKGNASTEASVSTGNYQKYTLKTAEKYYLIERVGSTFIYSYSNKTESEKLDNIIKELGY